MNELKCTETPDAPLTPSELEEIAYMEAAAVAGMLAAREAAQSNDNYGGALLHGEIPFGD